MIVLTIGIDIDTLISYLEKELNMDIYIKDKLDNGVVLDTNMTTWVVLDYDKYQNVDRDIDRIIMPKRLDKLNTLDKIDNLFIKKCKNIWVI